MFWWKHISNLRTTLALLIYLNSYVTYEYVYGKIKERHVDTVIGR